MREIGLLRAFDVYLVESTMRAYGIEKSTLQQWLILTRVCNDTEAGNVCLDMAQINPDQPPVGADDGIELQGENREQIAEAWRGFAAAAQNNQLNAVFQGMEGIASAPEHNTPFVLHGSKLYLRRYWQYEQTIATRLASMADDTSLAQTLTQDMAGQISAMLQNSEQQQKAARIALTRRLAMITGGAGAGKTFTAAAIISLLSRTQSATALRIKLAAPTGKAAARLGESIANAQAILMGSGSRPALEIPKPATLHRLLGMKENSPKCYYNADNPLPADFVVVDETSMVGIEVMAKLLDALPENARLLLLGDENQLASVQPGKVLAELCSSARLEPCIARLTESRRFGSDTPIGKLSTAILNARTETDANNAFDTAQSNGIIFNAAHPDNTRPTLINQAFAEHIQREYTPLLQAQTPEEAHAGLRSFRVLCALNKSPIGVTRANKEIENILSGKSEVTPALPAGKKPPPKLNTRGEFYNRRAIIVTKNDYALGLFNSDIGIVMPDPESENGRSVFFEQHDARLQHDAPFKKISCASLPEHETAFAMTVHKAQGSEFRNVLLILSTDAEHPILTRELLYTALTRASEQILIWTTREAFVQAVLSRSYRATGLSEALENAHSATTSATT